MFAGDEFYQPYQWWLTAVTETKNQDWGYVRYTCTS